MTTPPPSLTSAKREEPPLPTHSSPRRSPLPQHTDSLSPHSAFQKDERSCLDNIQEVLKFLWELLCSILPFLASPKKVPEADRTEPAEEAPTYHVGELVNFFPFEDSKVEFVARICADAVEICGLTFSSQLSPEEIREEEARIARVSEAEYTDFIRDCVLLSRESGRQGRVFVRNPLSHHLPIYIHMGFRMSDDPGEVPKYLFSWIDFRTFTMRKVLAPVGGKVKTVNIRKLSDFQKRHFLTAKEVLATERGEIADTTTLTKADIADIREHWYWDKRYPTYPSHQAAIEDALARGIRVPEPLYRGRTFVKL